jgi:16S rRNA (adenine1518-N6/adenine1519-N6)-dimethyltransferase
MAGMRQQPVPLNADPLNAVPRHAEPPHDGNDHAAWPDVTATPGHARVSLLRPADVRALAHRLGLRPTKQRGQNFVIDPNTIRRIVRTAAPPPDAVILEIGPGLGSLTLGLLDAAPEGSVTAVEVDPLLADALPATVAAHAPTLAGRLRVLNQDALRVDTLPGPAPTDLVANLPYNVAVPVLLHVLRTQPSIQRALVMVQAEVADRLAAEPGNRDYGVPSVKARWYGQVRRAGSVGRAVFWPAPHVDSGLVALTRTESPTGATRDDVFAVVDAAFAQRRKMLRSALAGWAGSPAAAVRVLDAAGVAPTARGEALSLDDYVRIAAAGAAGRWAPHDLPEPPHGPEAHDDSEPHDLPEPHETPDAAT